MVNVFLKSKILRPPLGVTGCVAIKIVFLLFSSLFSNYLYAQSTVGKEVTTCNNTYVNSSLVRDKNHFFPNTNIGKAALSLYGGLGYTPYSGNLPEYFKPDMGGTMSLGYFTYNNMAYFLSMSITSSALKKNISEEWQKRDSVTFSLVGFAVGYSFLNHIHWRITPFCGLGFSSSKPKTIEQHSDLSQFRTRLAPTPTIGVNITYKFIKPQKYRDFDGTTSCFALNAQINYAPFSAYNKKLPYRGGVLYLTIGASIEIFNTHGK